MLASKGEMSAPCGVPTLPGVVCPASCTPTFSHFRIRRITLGSPTRCSTKRISHSWSTVSKEKGSDVNLGVHLVRDAFRGAFDLAAVLTNDTDLVEPVRIVTQELGLPVTLLSPTGEPAASLTGVATSVRHVRPYVGPCQMPDQVTLPNGRIRRKPVGW